MKKGKLNDIDLDKLLKSTLKDDLPKDLGKRMQERIENFKKKVLTKNDRPVLEKRKKRENILSGLRIDWIRWFFRKEIAAAAALLMIISGVYLHTSGSKSVFSENLALLGTSIQVSNSVNNAATMICSVRVELKGGDHYDYLIQWLSPGSTRVDITQSEGRPIKTIWFSDHGILVSDHDLSTKEHWESILQIKDPIITPVLDIISPQFISDIMQGRWQLKDYSRVNNTEMGHFIILSAEEDSNLEVSVDMNTFLPVKAAKLIPDSEIETNSYTVMQIDFKWDSLVSPDLMVPEIQRKNRNA